MKHPFGVKIYDSFLRIRMNLLKPILFGLTKLGINANLIAFFSITIILLAFLYIDTQPEIAAILWIFVAIFLDALDGPLARYQNTASDKGKFIDVVKDYAVFAIFILALLKYNHIDAFWGSLYLFSAVIFDISSITYTALHTKSNWLFYPSSSFFSSAFLFALPIFFIIELVFSLDFINKLLIPMDFMISFGILNNLIKIIKTDKKMTMVRYD